MTDEDLATYRTERFEKLRSFYDRRSATNKRMHRLSSGYIILVSSLIPVMVGTGILSNYKVCGSLLSATIVAVTAWTAVAQYHENWSRYRRTWDALNREDAFFLAKANVYSDSDRCNCLFVERVEALVDVEGRDWESRHAPRAANAGETKGRSSC